MNKKKKVTVQYIFLVILSALSVLFSGLLLISALLKTAVANNMSEQKMIIEGEKIIPVIISLVIFFALGYFLFQRVSEWHIETFFLLVIGFHAIMGTVLVLFGRSAPGGDSASVYNMALQLSEKDLSFIGNPDSYLSFYPQQIGLTVLLAGIIKIIKFIPFNFSPHNMVKIFYVALNCVTITFGYLTVKEIWRSKKVAAAFLYLSIFNLPFIMYSSFIYGEIPSLATMSAATYFLCRLERKKGVPVLNIIFSAVFTALSVFVRKNSLIFMIAAVIVLILLFIGKRNKEYLITAIVAFIASVLILPATLHFYELKVNGEVDGGVTMYSYLAMGMQDTSSRGPGWYNAFNFNTYKNTGMDKKETNRISSEVIKERMDYFKENPKECFSFYRDKFLTQWTDPTLASCQATYNDFGGRAEVIQKIYDGDYNKYYVFVCNMFQNVIYIGVFIWSINNFRKMVAPGKKDTFVLTYIGIITVIGGFLFHMLWEANSRYIFPYAMMLIPYAAFGYGNLMEHNILNDYDD